MKRYLTKIDKNVCHGSGVFTEAEIMQGHKKIQEDYHDNPIFKQIQELNRQNQEMLPKPEPEKKKEVQQPPTTTLQQRKKKGPTGQFGIYD